MVTDVESTQTERGRRPKRGGEEIGLVKVPDKRKKEVGGYMVIIPESEKQHRDGGEVETNLIIGRRGVGVNYAGKTLLLVH